MKLRYALAGLALAVGLAAGGIATAIGSGDGTADGVTESATEQGPFVGLTTAQATELAEEEGREWRIAREDAEAFDLNDDLVPGRVTFEIDDGIVTSAHIQEPNTDPPPGDEVVFEDEAQAQLLANAVERLLTVDNAMGTTDAFDDIRVGRAIEGGRPRPLQQLDLEVIAGTLGDLGAITFVDDPSGEIESLFENPPRGTAVVTVTDLVLLDDHAQVGLHLWCGPLCGVFLTYEATPADPGWAIIGTTGPISIS